MKKMVFAGVLGLLSVAVYAQTWTVGGRIDFRSFSYESNGNRFEGSDFSLSVDVGRYVTNDISIGLSAGFGISRIDGDSDGSNFTIGPFLKYNVLEFDRVYFAVTGGLLYTRFLDSPGFIGGHRVDANRVAISLTPSVAYRVSNNIEIFWQFASISFTSTSFSADVQFDGWPGTFNIERTQNVFQVQGPFSNPLFGITFRF